MPDWVPSLLRRELGRQCQVRQWRQGLDFKVYRVACASGQFVLRVPLREFTVTSYGETVDFALVVEREAAAYALFESAKVPVPRLLSWGKRSDAFDHSWMISEFIDHDETVTMNGDQEESAGEVVRLLHSAVPPRGFVGPGGTGGPDALAERLARRYRRAAVHYRLPAAERVLPAAIAAIQEERELEPAPLHMDLRPPNLCFSGAKLIALLDLSNCIAGSVLTEFGRLYAYGGLSRRFLRGYGITEFSAGEWRRVLAYSIDTFALLITVAAEELADETMLRDMGQKLTATAERIVTLPVTG